MNEQKKTNNSLIFFNEALEYLEHAINLEPNNTIIQNDDTTNNLMLNANLLRDEMLDELNNLRQLISSNPDLKLEALDEKDKRLFFKFITYYSTCPICGNTNHYSNLKKFYFNEEMNYFKEILTNNMKLKNEKHNLKISFGIPCCLCFKKYFGEE